MSGSSSSVPSGNHFACSVRNVRGMSQPRAVRPGEELQRGLRGDRVDRHPHRHVVPAVDVVVGLVLVPRRGLPGSGLLDQHVVVVEPDDASCPSGRRRRRRPSTRTRSAGTPRCAASCRSPRRSGPGRRRGWRRRTAAPARRGCARCRARTVSTSSASKRPADDAAAVLAEGGDGLVVDDPAIDRRHSSIPRSRMSLATCPVALTLRKACSMTPVGEMTKVERITPVTTLPYSFFSP